MKRSAVRTALGFALAFGAAGCSGQEPGHVADSVDSGIGSLDSGASGGSTGGTAGDPEQTSGASAGTAASATTGSDTSGMSGVIFDVGNADTGGGFDTGNMNDCEAPTPVPCDADSDDPFHAMGLDCPGGPFDSIPISNAQISSPDPGAWRVARQYGTYIDPNTNEPVWGPREGEKLLFVSSGTIGAPDANGVITRSGGTYQPGDANANPDGQPLPGPISAQKGSNNGAGGTPFMMCDGTNDCSDSLYDQWQIGDQAANDLLWFSFDITVPAGTHGYQFDFAWFSAEYPEWVSPEPFNDVGLWWSTSETFTGNVTFINDQPLTVTALQDAVHDQGYWGNDPELQGTGFAGMEGFFCLPQNPFGESNCPIGGGTGWYTTTGSVQPGETLTMAFAIFDMGDSIYDTVMLLDNFQWDCQGCDPEMEECGIAPAG